MADYVTAYFTTNTVPATGLSPTVTIAKVSDGVAVKTNEAMTHANLGWYRYSFSDRDSSIDYIARADGGAGQPAGERYVTISIPADNDDLAFIYNIESGGWKRDGTQMIFYKSDNTTEVARFNLLKADGSPAGEDDDVYSRERV